MKRLGVLLVNTPHAQKAFHVKFLHENLFDRRRVFVVQEQHIPPHLQKFDNKNLSGYFNLIKNKRIILYLKLRYKSVFLLMKIFLNDIS